MVKSGIRYLGKFLLLLFILIIGYFLMALILSIISTNPKGTYCTESNELFLSTNGVHLDIVIPKYQLPRTFQQELQLKDNIRYVSFGWGDKGFYLETPTWSDLKFSTAVRAILLKSETAMHLTNYQDRLNSWYSITICKFQLELLTQYIMNTFSRGEEGQLLRIPDSGYTNYDEFYVAKGSYNLINTCNYWVNKGLKTAKIKTSIWSPFDEGVLFHLEK